jgi:hypothetical protein
MTELDVRVYRPIGKVRPIGQVRPQERVVVSGEIRSSTAMALRGCPACKYELVDGTGELDLMFLGRVEVRGLEKGRRCTAEGMAATRDDRIVLWNPRYQLEPADDEACDVSGPALPEQAGAGQAVPTAVNATTSG